MSDADDTLPPDAVDDTQPGQTLSDERKGGVGRPSRRVTFEVNATPLGATARDFVFAKSEEWSVDYASKVLPSGPPGTWQFIERCGIFTSCPKCHTSSFLLPSVSRVMPDGAIHAIQRDGKTVHRFNCGSKKCDWEARQGLGEDALLHRGVQQRVEEEGQAGVPLRGGKLSAGSDDAGHPDSRLHTDRRGAGRRIQGG